MMNSNSMSEARAANNDFATLQREYRNMEMNRKAYVDESHRVMRRQQVTIEKLRKENELLRQETALESRYMNSSKITKQQEVINELQDHADQYNEQLDKLKTQLGTTHNQTSLMQQKILHQRRHMGGVNAARDNQRMIQKQIRILENRLDKALIKFNEALANNKSLREQIDNLRQERVVFDNIYMKLEKELVEKKKQMANIIEMSNLAYEQRDGAQLEIAAIEQQNRREAGEFDEQMQDLHRIIEEDKKRVAEMANNGGGALGNMSVDAEANLKSKVTKGAWGVAKDMVNTKVTIERVQSCEEAFNKIRAATGITDIDELVRTFIQNEDQNFSLFNYANEQQNEVERLEEQMAELKDEEKKFSQETGEDASHQKQLVRDLEVRLQQTEAMADRYELRCQESQKTLNSVKIGIQSIFNRLECSGSTMSEILADSNITEANMMQYLGVVEQRANELLTYYAQIEAEQISAANAEESAAATAVNVLGLGPATPMLSEQLHVQPPNLDDYSSDSEDDGDAAARPLTRTELKTKTLKNIHNNKTKQAMAARRKAKRSAGR